MGYFSNGSEGDGYEECYCETCAHHHGPDSETGCAVWFIHTMFNYDQLTSGQEKLRTALRTLIPEDRKGLNGKCAMWIERKG